jgi:phosphomannomutase
MAMAQIFFGTDGWRGVIAEDFTVANVRKVAYAIARYVVRAAEPARGMLVGYDTRFASERCARAAAEAVALTGTPVWLSETECPSPALSLLVRLRGAAGGIMITASHNPYRWNGVKFKASYGSSALPAIVEAIEREVEAVEREGVPALPARDERVHSLDVRAPYLETLARLVDWDRLREAGMRFVVDPMHGAARGLLAELFRRNGVTCEEIRGARDPLFGGANPEPIEPHIEPLRQALERTGCDAGFALDGDGDRVGAIDRAGRFINAHQCFSILLWHLAGTRKLPGDVAKTFSVTKMVDRIAEKFGRQLYEVPIGFKYICELMLERDILIGGEESGGIGYKFHLPERDATLSALLLAEVMAWHRKSLGVLVELLEAEFGRHCYGRVDLTLAPGVKEKALEHFANPALARFGEWPVARREDLDGIKLYLDEIGWVMLRASGTEPMLRIYAETTREETTRAVLERMAALLHTLGGAKPR